MRVITLLARLRPVRAVLMLVIVMLMLAALAIELTYSSPAGHGAASNGVINTDGSQASSGIVHAEHGVTTDGIQGSG